MKKEISLLVYIPYHKECVNCAALQIAYKKLIKHKKTHDLHLIIMSSIEDQQPQVFFATSNQINKENHEIISDFLDRQIEKIQNWQNIQNIKVEKFICINDMEEDLKELFGKYRDIKSIFIHGDTKNETTDNFDKFMNIIYKKLANNIPILIIPENFSMEDNLLI